MYKEISVLECEIKQEKESDFFLVSGLKEGDFIKVQVELTDCGELNGIYYPIIKIKGTRKIKNNTLIQTDSIMSDNDLVIKSDIYIRKYAKKYVSEYNYDKFIGYTEK